MKLRSLALAFTAIVALAGAANAQQAGDFPITDANGYVDNANNCPFFDYSFAQNWTFAVASGGFTISNDGLAGNGFASKLYEQADHTPCASSSGDVFTIHAVTGGFTIQDNSDSKYLADTGSAQTVSGYTGKGLIFQTAPYTWTITGMGSSSGASVDLSDGSHVVPGANGNVLGVVSGAWTSTAGTPGPQGPTGATGPAGANAGQSGTFTPSSGTAACATGQSGFDATYIYTCTATNTWKRTSTGSTF